MVVTITLTWIVPCWCTLSTNVERNGLMWLCTELFEARLTLHVAVYRSVPLRQRHTTRLLEAWARDPTSLKLMSLMHQRWRGRSLTRYIKNKTQICPCVYRRLTTPYQQPSPYSQFSLKLCTYKPPGTLIESDSTICCMCTTVSSWRWALEAQNM